MPAKVRHNPGTEHLGLKGMKEQKRKPSLKQIQEKESSIQHPHLTDWRMMQGNNRLFPNQRCVHMYSHRVSANCLRGTPKYPQYHYKSFLPASQHSPARSISHFPHKNDRLTLSSHLHKSPTDNHKYFSYADLWKHKQD